MEYQTAWEFMDYLTEKAQELDTAPVELFGEMLSGVVNRDDRTEEDTQFSLLFYLKGKVADECLDKPRYENGLPVSVCELCDHGQIIDYCVKANGDFTLTVVKPCTVEPKTYEYSKGERVKRG